MDNVISLFGDKHAVKIVEDHSCNDRSLVSFYSDEWKCYCIILFHVAEQVNELSKSSPYTTWGYYTHGVKGIHSRNELKEVTNMYLKDIIEGRTWWENDN